MAADDTSVTSSTSPSEPAGTDQSPSVVGNFWVGAGLSAIAVLSLLGISLWTTPTALSQIGPLEIAALLAIPLGCGGLAIVFKKQFVEALSVVLNSLPF